MGRTKEHFIAVAAAAFVFGFACEVRGADPEVKPQSYEYTGVIKAKSEETHTLTMQTRTGPVSFHYQRHGKKECAGFKELAAGDSIKVIASEKKAVSEATCITKTGPVATPK
jgi:hypothetical protein